MRAYCMYDGGDLRLSRLSAVSAALFLIAPHAAHTAVESRFPEMTIQTNPQSLRYTKRRVSPPPREQCCARESSTARVRSSSAFHPLQIHPLRLSFSKRGCVVFANTRICAPQSPCRSVGCGVRGSHDVGARVRCQFAISHGDTTGATASTVVFLAPSVDMGPFSAGGRAGRRCSRRSKENRPVFSVPLAQRSISPRPAAGGGERRLREGKRSWRQRRW